jgi:hypothetical protein
MPTLDVTGRCDLGFNTAAFNDAAAMARLHAHDHEHSDVDDMANPSGHVDFTLEEWASTFTDESLGMDVGEVVDAVSADDIYRRHVLAGVLTHTLLPDPWTPMTDRAGCDALADQLRTARRAAQRYPTVADAEAAGYTLGDSYNAGLGVHYQNWSLVGPFDPDRPLELLYDGTEPGSRMVGLAYVVLQEGDDPPAGFAGDNDRWHRHRTFCLDLDRQAYNFATDILDADECAALGGTLTPNESWMLHTWVVPGCESDWGVFSGANPRLPYMPPYIPTNVRSEASFASGCNSGATIADPLDLDGRGDGPGLS